MANFTLQVFGMREEIGKAGERGRGKITEEGGGGRKGGRKKKRRMGRGARREGRRER